MAAFAGAATLVGASAATEFSIRGSHAWSTESPLHEGWQVFDAYVESASSGRIDVSVSPASQFGSIKRALEQAKIDAIEMAQGDEQNLDGFCKPMMSLATTYLFASDEEGQRFLDSDLFMDVREKLARASGLQLLAASSYGFRCFTSNVKPIRSAAEMDGIRMRVPPSPSSLAIIEEMGGPPAAVPWEELYGAM